MKNYLKAQFTNAQLTVMCTAIIMLITGFVVNVLLGFDTAGIELNYAIPLGILVVGATLHKKFDFVYDLAGGKYSRLIVSSAAVLILGALICVDGTECLSPLLLVPLGFVATTNKEHEGGTIVYSLALSGVILLASLLSLELVKKLYAYVFVIASIPTVIQVVLNSEYKEKKEGSYKGHNTISILEEVSICLFIINFLLASVAMKSEIFNILGSFLWIAPSLPKIFSDFKPISFNTAVSDPNLTLFDSIGRAFGYIPYILVMVLVVAFFVFGLRLRKEKHGICQDITVYMLLAIFMPMLCSILYKGEILIPFMSNSLLCNAINAVVLVLAAFLPEQSSLVLAVERQLPGLSGSMAREGAVLETKACLYSEDISKHKNDITSYFPEKYEEEIANCLDNVGVAELTYVFGDSSLIAKYMLRKSLEERIEEAYLMVGNEEFHRLKNNSLMEFIERMNSGGKGIFQEILMLTTYKETGIIHYKEEEK